MAGGTERARTTEEDQIYYIWEMHFHLNDQIYFSSKSQYYYLYLCAGRFLPEIQKTTPPTYTAAWKCWVGMRTLTTPRSNLQPVTDGNWHRSPVLLSLSGGSQLWAPALRIKRLSFHCGNWLHNDPLLHSSDYINNHTPLPMFPKFSRKLKTTSIQIFISKSARGGT